MSLKDNNQLLIIDYEYAGWNPMPMDLANYLYETMIDNAHPFGFGLKLYLDNCMDQQQLREMATVYLSAYHNKYLDQTKKDTKGTTNSFIETHLDEFI